MNCMLVIDFYLFRSAKIISLNLIFSEMNVLLCSFLILNGIAFLLIGYDKYLAKKHKQRISERTLLSFVFIGGIIGSGLAMLIFNHKTSKISYLWKYWGILFLQYSLFFLWFYLKYQEI